MTLQLMASRGAASRTAMEAITQRDRTGGDEEKQEREEPMRQQTTEKQCTMQREQHLQPQLQQQQAGTRREDLVAARNKRPTQPDRSGAAHAPAPAR